MVLGYLGIQSSLGDLIARAEQIDSENGGFDPDCRPIEEGGNPVCLSAGALADVGRGYGLSVRAHDYGFQSSLWNALKSKQPIIVLVRTGMDLSPDPNDPSKLKNNGHFVVVTGLDLDSNEIVYNDPLDGPDQRKPWSLFFSVWMSHVDDKDPLQPGGHVNWMMTVALPN